MKTKKTKKYMAGGMAMPGAGGAPMGAAAATGGGAPAMPMTEEQKKKKMMEEMMKKKMLAGGGGAPMGGAPAPAGTTMTAKAGGKVPKAKKKGGMAAQGRMDSGTKRMRQEKETNRKQDLDMGTDPKTGKKPELKPSDYDFMKPAAKRPAMKKGGKVKTYKSGGKVRGAGIAKQGVRKCKMR